MGMNETSVYIPHINFVRNSYPPPFSQMFVLRRLQNISKNIVDDKCVFQLLNTPTNNIWKIIDQIN